jgi:uncharacterized membrane protein YccC
MVLTLFIIFHYLKIADETWVLFIFMTTFEYATVECTFKKGHQRALVLLCSVAYSLLVIFLFNNNYVMNLVALVGGFLVYTYLFIGTPLGYMGIVGCAIMTLMLINHNDAVHSILRALIILTTIGVSMLVTRLFYPEYASDEVIQVEANFIAYLSEWVESFVVKNSLNKSSRLTIEKKLNSETLAFYNHIEHMDSDDKKRLILIENHLRFFEQLKTIYQLLQTLLYYKKDYVKDEQLKQMSDYFQSIQARLLSLPNIEYSFNPLLFQEKTDSVPQILWKDISQHLHLLEETVEAVLFNHHEAGKKII